MIYYVSKEYGARKSMRKFYFGNREYYKVKKIYGVYRSLHPCAFLNISESFITDTAG